MKDAGVKLGQNYRSLEWEWRVIRAQERMGCSNQEWGWHVLASRRSAWAVAIAAVTNHGL